MYIPAFVIIIHLRILIRLRVTFAGIFLLYNLCIGIFEIQVKKTVDVLFRDKYYSILHYVNELGKNWNDLKTDFRWNDAKSFVILIDQEVEWRNWKCWADINN